MSWNYRIVKHRSEKEGEWFGLHEVHYGADGKETGCSENPTTFVGDTPEDVRSALILALSDARRRPVFEKPELWSSNGKK